MTTLPELEAQARREVDAVRDEPEGRYRLREAFYRKYGFGKAEKYGEGTSELAFMRWEIERGVLAKTGSPWWRAVNEELLYRAQLAGLVYEAGLVSADVGGVRAAGAGGPRITTIDHETRCWLDYIAQPRATTWYRAHNASIVRGYLGRTADALLETEPEQLFMNEVLYRLLYAEALVMGDALGALGALLADPELPGVGVIVHLDAFYPRHYPLSAAEIADVQHRGRTFAAALEDILDEGFVLPHLTQLYDLVATAVDEPDLRRLVQDGVPIYPRMAVPGPGPDVPAPSPPARKQRIAILGGGMAGLTAAWELTRTPGWESAYEVTLYQLGWRLGGKTATGRGPHERIEEHGIHILQGWYDNTWQLVRDVYRERREKKLDPRSPFQSWEEAFERNDSTIITEWVPQARRWVHWPLIFPRNDAVPGDGPPLPTWEVIKKLVGIVLELVLGSPYQTGIGALAKHLLDHFFPPDGDRPKDHPELLAHARDLVGALDAPRLGAAGKSAADSLLSLMETALAWLERELGKAEDFDFRVYRDVVLLELTLVALRGIFADVWKPAEGRFDFRAIDHLDFREWLKKHGASDRALRSGTVRFLYTGTFSNLADGRGEGGVIAAGTALRFLLESAGYKGSFVWQMRAGTGDTLVMPIYEVLESRGVSFRFFQNVRDLAVDDAGVSAVSIGQQVTLRGAGYEPTKWVGDVRAWPAEPLYGQIDEAQAAELRERKIDLESPWADWTDPATVELRRGADFDQVILAIPIASLKACCKSIVACDERWQRMIANVRTTATMSMQLWLAPSLRELGFVPGDWGLAERDCAANVVTYADPMYSWLDSSLVLPQERWPAADAPKMLAYYTGAMRDPDTIPPFEDHGYPERADGRLRTLMEQWLTDRMGYFWPAGATPEEPNGLDFGHLVGAGAGASPAQRYRAQYFRANVLPWARYTLSAPGTARYRLRADQSGYANLFLAGDWIDFGMNVGYIEGAITSGAQAAVACRRAMGLPDAPPVFHGLDPE